MMDSPFWMHNNHLIEVLWGLVYMYVCVCPGYAAVLMYAFLGKIIRACCKERKRNGERSTSKNKLRVASLCVTLPT